MLKREIINSVKINQFFHEFSAEYGYDAEKYLDELYELINKWEHDPLLVIKLSQTEEGKPYVSVRFITDHDQLFGSRNLKYNKSSLAALRKAVDNRVKSGDQHDI